MAQSVSYFEEVYDPWTKKMVMQERGCRRCGRIDNTYYLDSHLCLPCCLQFAAEFLEEHPERNFSLPKS